jgi:hypothetical protein
MVSAPGLVLCRTPEAVLTLTPQLPGMTIA